MTTTKTYPIRIITDRQLQQRWAAISMHLTKPTKKSQYKSFVAIADTLFIQKKKTMFRIIGRIDWVFYEPAQLALAIDTGKAEDYYYKQLSDPRSYPNNWRNPDEEYVIKEHYAHRRGRKLDKKDNLPTEIFHIPVGYYTNKHYVKLDTENNFVAWISIKEGRQEKRRTAPVEWLNKKK